MSLVLGINPAAARNSNVLFVEPTWGDAATWASLSVAVAGAPTSNLTTRQPVQVAGYEASEDIIIEGTLATAQPLDVVSIPYATATPAAQWRVRCGDSSLEASGVRANDVSGNGYYGLRNGATAFAQGKFGSGLAFGNEDHDDDYVVTNASVTASEDRKSTR